MRRGIVAGTFLLVVTAGVVMLLRSAPAGCAYPAPVNSNLPAALRSLGGFDQPLDSATAAALQPTALTAATTLHTDLIGAFATAPVDETRQGNGPDSIVVPLGRRAQGGVQIVALVSYLRDCSGRPYFASVDDLVTRPVTAFPAETEAAARQRLHDDHVQLRFSADPFQPTWVPTSQATALPP